MIGTPLAGYESQLVAGTIVATVTACERRQGGERYSYSCCRCPLSCYVHYSREVIPLDLDAEKLRRIGELKTPSVSPAQRVVSLDVTHVRPTTT